MFRAVLSSATVAATGVRNMDQQIIICFGCRKRTTAEEIKSGQHSHADLLELEAFFDPAVNADE